MPLLPTMRYLLEIEIDIKIVTSENLGSGGNIKNFQCLSILVSLCGKTNFPWLFFSHYFPLNPTTHKSPLLSHNMFHSLIISYKPNYGSSKVMNKNLKFLFIMNNFTTLMKVLNHRKTHFPHQFFLILNTGLLHCLLYIFSLWPLSFINISVVLITHINPLGPKGSLNPLKILSPKQHTF